MKKNKPLSPKEERKPWIKKLDAINAQLKKGICTEVLIEKKQTLALKMLTSYQLELPRALKVKNSNRKQYIEKRIKYWKQVLIDIENAKNGAHDLTESTAYRCGIEYCDKDTQRLLEQLKQRRINRFKFEKKLESIKQDKQQAAQLSTEQKEEINFALYGENISATQRKKWINQYILANAELKLTQAKDPSNKEKLLAIYNEKLYLLHQIMDSYKREKETAPHDYESITPHWKQELHMVGTERDTLLTKEKSTDSQNDEQQSLGLSKLFDQKDNQDLTKAVIREPNSLQTIKEETTQEIEKLSNKEQIPTQKAHTPSALSKLFGWMIFWK